MTGRKRLVLCGLLPCLVLSLLLVTTVWADPTGPAAGAPAQAAAPPGGQANPAPAADANDLNKLLDLADKDVGQLSQVSVASQAPAFSAEVTSVSRHESTMGRSPAAVFVISNEMIRRSGVRSVPEALRMAPGVQVARIDSSRYAISIRGFNSRFSDKLLVLIDGRTVYTPLFGGVFWDAQDVLLEDVDRIEVIRGPGGTLWGANAVNGIINVITKKASKTQGVFAEAGGGTFERGFTSARYGGKLGDDATYRIYGKWFDRGPGENSLGQDVDEFRQGRGGFRTDWTPSDRDTVTLQGDAYAGKAGYYGTFPTLTPPDFLQGLVDAEQASGQNLLWRWTHTLGEASEWSFQSYYDHTERDWLLWGCRENRSTFDVDFYHRFPLGQRHSLTWGCGYRNTSDELGNAPFGTFFQPTSRDDNIFSYFLQDEITLSKDLWYLTVGSKFLHSGYTPFEFQPTVRLLWTPTTQYSIWCAVTRAVRTPTRADQDAGIAGLPMATFPVPVFPLAMGQRAFDSEDLLAYETGIRGQPTDKFSWDLAVFYNNYSKLRDMRVHPPILGYPTYIPLVLVNLDEAKTYGFELASNYQVTERWKLYGGYSFLRLTDLPPHYLDANDPRNQIYLQSSWDIGHRWQLDMIWRYVDALTTISVPSYNVMDVRLAWHPRKQLETGVVGRNLLRGPHHEFAASPMMVTLPTEVAPEVYGYVTWRY
jgi:iron complex outermembrane receptor protein